MAQSRIQAALSEGRITLVYHNRCHFQSFYGDKNSVGMVDLRAGLVVILVARLGAIVVHIPPTTGPELMMEQFAQLYHQNKKHYFLYTDHKYTCIVQGVESAESGGTMQEEQKFIKNKLQAMSFQRHTTVYLQIQRRPWTRAKFSSRQQTNHLY